MRAYFKRLHETLYDIEREKEGQLSSLLCSMLGPLHNEGGVKEAARLVTDCDKKYSKISTRIEKEEFEETQKKQGKYDSLL